LLCHLLRINDPNSNKEIVSLQNNRDRVTVKKTRLLLQRKKLNLLELLIAPNHPTQAKEGQCTAMMRRRENSFNINRGEMRTHTERLE